MQNTINIVIKELWQCKMNQRDHLVLVIFMQDLLAPDVMPFSISENVRYLQVFDRRIRMCYHKVNGSRTHLQTCEHRCCHHLFYHHPGSSHIHLDQLDFQHPTKSKSYLLKFLKIASELSNVFTPWIVLC